MKSYIYLLLFALALPAVPLANAGQAEDPALEAAHQAFEEALNCVRPPYAKVECVTQPGGSVVTIFTQMLGDQIIAEALQDGSFPREWRVFTNSLTCEPVQTGYFTSKGQGFHPWKRDLLDFCTACLNDLGCLNLAP